MTTKPMLAKNYESQDPTGWLLSEKLDGVRAIWTGSELLSRNGNRFFAPDWFTSMLPAGIRLDGELFIGRGRFQETVSVVRKQEPVAGEWQAVTYRVFDAPEKSGGFEQRLGFCSEILEGSPVACVVEHEVCRGREHLADFFGTLCAAGAEGVMLRRPGSAYEPRRSASLLKYKPFESDEATLIGSEPGEGRLQGLVGALLLTWRGVTFAVGTGLSDEQRANPPRTGARITFGFCGLTDGGIPRFPTFIAERSYE